MAIVYRHRRLDTFEVFYVGIGKTKKRAAQKGDRNDWWKRIVDKAGYQVEILATNLSKKEAIELEIFLIEEYGRRDIGTGCLCNMTSGGEGTCEKSPESMKKIAESKHIPVEQYDCNYNFIKEYPSIKEASEELGLRYSNLVRACNQEIRNCGKFIWKHKGKNFLEKDWKHPSYKRPVTQYDLNGEFIGEFESVQEAQRKTKVKNISPVCKGQYGRNTAGGYIWKYKK